ncbi:hypothetical protein MIMGU_mgv1a016492mg [Erythranthe guttata]|uniref:Uncharacterized protein n=1 Tax=Erythranthe guttata TaxID=4155 RepID=A0A022QVN6_ERYGU|nr:hypothetical protein MIMGU_mgv1a016492mg [Erythranthe guttata]
MTFAMMGALAWQVTNLIKKDIFLLGERHGVFAQLSPCVCRVVTFVFVRYSNVPLFNSIPAIRPIKSPAVFKCLVLSNKQKYHNPFSFKCAPSSCGLLGNLLIERYKLALVKFILLLMFI